MKQHVKWSVNRFNRHNEKHQQEKKKLLTKICLSFSNSAVCAIMCLNCSMIFGDIINLTLSITAMSELNQFIIRLNGVVWKKNILIFGQLTAIVVRKGCATSGVLHIVQMELETIEKPIPIADTTLQMPNLFEICGKELSERELIIARFDAFACLLKSFYKNRIIYHSLIGKKARSLQPKYQFDRKVMFQCKISLHYVIRTRI